jgi:hypothetical protein
MTKRIDEILGDTAMETQIEAALAETKIEEQLQHGNISDGTHRHGSDGTHRNVSDGTHRNASNAGANSRSADRGGKSESPSSGPAGNSNTANGGSTVATSKAASNVIELLKGNKQKGLFAGLFGVGGALSEAEKPPASREEVRTCTEATPPILQINLLDIRRILV